MTTQFSAGGSAIGYLYQSRYALYLLLQRIDSSVSIERLLQLKHHLNSNASLTNACVDLWKTIRVWSEALRSGTTIARLTLITTSTASQDTIGYYLKDNMERNPAKAKTLMLQVACTSTNETNPHTTHFRHSHQNNSLHL